MTSPHTILASSSIEATQSIAKGADCRVSDIIGERSGGQRAFHGKLWQTFTTRWVAGVGSVASPSEARRSEMSNRRVCHASGGKRSHHSVDVGWYVWLGIAPIVGAENDAAWKTALRDYIA